MLSAKEASFWTTLGNIHWKLQEMKFTLKIYPTMAQE